MTIATSQTDVLGANPFDIEGPITSGSGYPAPNFALGTVVRGPSEATWVYCKYVPAGTVTMAPGLVFQFDQDFTATLVTTAAGTDGYRVGVWGGSLYPPSASNVADNKTVSLAAGTYYIWLQVTGQAAVKVTTATAAKLVAESTTTGGTINVPSSATTSTKIIARLSFQAANFTFTADVTSGSTILTNVSGATIYSGPFIGATLSATGIASSQTVAGITYTPAGVIKTITLSAAASASASATTVTATGVLEAGLIHPRIEGTN